MPRGASGDNTAGTPRMRGRKRLAIRIHLDDVLRDRGMSLTELSQEVGVTIANLSILKTGKAKAVRFTTLDKICRALGCQPGDILVWEE